MPTFKVFTWNMQRAQSISGNDNTILLRYQVLQSLVNWADFGFITEPGKDIRTNLNQFPTTWPQSKLLRFTTAR